MALQILIHPVTKAERVWVSPGLKAGIPLRPNGSRLHFGPQASLGQAPRQVYSGPAPYFEALAESPDRTPIPSYATALRSALTGFSRQRLSALGRYLYDNDGWVSLAVDQIANYSAPITPMAANIERNLSFPAAWRFFGPKSTSVAANKELILSLTCYGLAESDVRAACAAEQ